MIINLCEKTINKIFDFEHNKFQTKRQPMYLLNKKKLLILFLTLSLPVLFSLKDLNKKVDFVMVYSLYVDRENEIMRKEYKSQHKLKMD